MHVSYVKDLNKDVIAHYCSMMSGGGLEHEFYFPFHIWDNPSHWRTHIFQDGTCTTNQIILQQVIYNIL